MSTTAPTKKVRRRSLPPSRAHHRAADHEDGHGVSQVEAVRRRPKAKVPREKRRGLKEYTEFERLYTELRRSGLKLADARKQVKAS